MGVFIYSHMYHLLGFIFLAYSFLQSFNLPPWPSAHSEFFAFTAIFFLIWNSAYNKKKYLININIPSALLFFLTVITALQFAFHKIIFFGDAAIIIYYFIICIAVIIITQWQEDDAKWLQYLAWTLLISAIISALIALIQSLWVWTDLNWITRYSGFRRSGAHLGQPNHLGTLLIMGSASLIYLNQRRHIRCTATIFINLVLIVGMGVTESRTGLISGSLLSLWFFTKREVFQHAPRWPWIAAFTLLLIATMLSWPSFISHVHEGGPLQESVLINTTSSMRVQGWLQIWEAAMINPWLGWGLHGTSQALNAVLHLHKESLPFTYAHNIFLDLVIGMGLPIAIIFTCIAGIWLVKQIKNSKSLETWYSIALILPFGVHSLLEFPFSYAYFLAPVMIAIGILEKNNSPIASINISKKIFLFLFIFLFSIFTKIAIEYIQIEDEFRIARFERIHITSTQKIHETQNIELLTQLNAMLIAFKTEPTPRMPQEKLENLRITALRFPWMPIQKTYIISLALNNDFTEATRQINVFRAMHGEKSYNDLKKYWKEITKKKYAQLNDFPFP